MNVNFPVAVIGTIFLVAIVAVSAIVMHTGTPSTTIVQPTVEQAALVNGEVQENRVGDPKRIYVGNLPPSSS